MKLVLLSIFFVWLFDYGKTNINLTDQYKDIATRLELKKTEGQCASCWLIKYETNKEISNIEGLSVSGYDLISTFLFTKQGDICQIVLQKSLPKFDSNVEEIETNFEELTQKLIKKYGKPESIDNDFYPSRTITWNRSKNYDYIILTFLQNDLHGNNTLYLTFFGNNYQQNCLK